jgi:lipopolysaccharide transport system ATP-binding protein
MSDVAIRVEAIGKYYRIGERDPYKMLRDVLVRFLSTQARRIGSRLTGRGPEINGDQNKNDFWALKDVSFEVKEGEALGIIGKNGAGKSTLLKILSRITLPTEGRAQMYGRLASLLEVGTGFHPELTGRDNIYLNGAILGMRRAEIERKFDEIVSFAEVERFIDTPVKHYSSGMYLRLAFAVAAHLEPEILLVDEVLAVGDVAFQKKCLGKMDDVTKQGRTILFVSHNLQAIAQLTHRCVLLSDGRLLFDGPTAQALEKYRESAVPGVHNATYYQTRTNVPHNHLAWVAVQTSIRPGLHRWGDPIRFEFGLRVAEPMEGLGLSFHVVNQFGERVCHFWMTNSDMIRTSEPRIFVLRCDVPKFRLYMGSYTITTWVFRGDTDLESLKGICPFDVTMDGIYREQLWKTGDCTYLEDADWDVAQDEKTR